MPSEPASLDRPEAFPFAGSVMSGLAFPEPFIPAPYDSNSFRPNGHHVDTAETAPEAAPHDTGTLGQAMLDQTAPGKTEPGGPAREMDLLDVDAESMLPRRVPSVPDVPEGLLSPNEPELADGVELSRIASYLRDTVDASGQRPDGFDMMAVVQAVRGVPDVSDAQLRWTPGYGHTLRIEFADGADEERVTRHVALLLRETMGLAAQPGPPSLAAARLSSEETTLDRPKRPSAATTMPTAARPARAEPAPRPARAEPAPRPARAEPAPVSVVDPVEAGHPLPPRRSVGDELSRVVLDHVQVTTLGLDATVEVRLEVSSGPSAGLTAFGKSHGPAVDAYLLRLAAIAAGNALDHVLLDRATGTARGRCFIEHVAVVPFGACEVAVVVLLLVRGSLAEQVAGSAIVVGDPRQAVVRATLSAVNRRLESLLS
jgi:hypothetical protein